MKHVAITRASIEEEDMQQQMIHFLVYLAQLLREYLLTGESAEHD